MPDTVADILAQKPGEIWSISPDCKVYNAIALMAEKNVGALPVLVDGEIVGIISERDYARRIILSSRSSRETAVKEIMTSPVIRVTPSVKVEECMRVVTTQRVRHLPVVDRNRLIGVISIGDLVKAIISDQAETIDQLHHYIAGKYP